MISVLNTCDELEIQANLQFFYRKTRWTSKNIFMWKWRGDVTNSHLLRDQHLFKPLRQLYAPLSLCGSGDNFSPLGQAVSPGSWPTSSRFHYYLWLSGSIQHPSVCQPSQPGLWKQPFLLDVFRFPEKSQYTMIKRLIPRREWSENHIFSSLLAVRLNPQKGVIRKSYLFGFLLAVHNWISKIS